MKEMQAQKRANDKHLESDRAVMGAEVSLIQWIPHKWKHTVSKAIISSCRVMITTAVASGKADADS